MQASSTDLHSSTIDTSHGRMPRLDALTGLRWWAAFAVFAHHISGFAPLPDVVMPFLRFGYLGVTFFFVLSGFVLTWSWSPGVRQSTFYWRRFARIYPSHVVALLIAIPVFVVFQPDPSRPWALPVDLGGLVLALFLLQAWSPITSVFFVGNPAAWTLTCEAFFYATHPHFSRLLARIDRRGALIFCGIVVVIAFAFRGLTLAPPTSWLAFTPQPVQYLPQFVLGMTLAWALRRGWLPRIPVTVGIGSVAVAIGAFVIVPRLFRETWIATILPSFVTEIAMVACALAIVSLAASGLRGRRSILAHPVMVRLGEWSFAFYLVHATILYAVLGWAGPQSVGWTAILWWVGLGAVCIGAAALLHHVVERPLERRMRAWKDRRDRIAANV